MPVYVIRFDSTKPERYVLFVRAADGLKETLCGRYPAKSKAMNAARLLAGWRYPIKDETPSARLA